MFPPLRSERRRARDRAIERERDRGGERDRQADRQRQRPADLGNLDAFPGRV